MTAIFKREFKAYFTSPIGYIYLGIFLFFSGFFFSAINLMYTMTDMSPFSRTLR